MSSPEISLTVERRSSPTVSASLMTAPSVCLIASSSRHYQQLREVLSDMEMKGIISKSLTSSADLNFSSLLCYLDDLLVFAPSEEEALRRQVVFSRLRANNLKLSQKKCNFLRKSVRFLGHIVDASGVSVDQEKVAVISGFRKEDLMDADGCTPSQQKVRSFLGMVLYYQHFIPGCSTIAKPLFALTAGQKRKLKGSRGTGGGNVPHADSAGLGSGL
ncbi:hypothetical protein AAFF_G00432160 [Aldrovandia affinis]|uniref:ribonuclease H n=1 Tax=Aldrovandia affinis TaxID=143900 RepID=A0AAD7R340_9TELE|nr:hypothetical protein AAFF_G00432160 [Aldrovandia affinis]